MSRKAMGDRIRADKKQQLTTDEFRQHHAVKEIPADDAGRIRGYVTDQRIIDKYFNDGHLRDKSDEGRGSVRHAAACRLLYHWRRAGQDYSGVVDLEAVRVDGCGRGDAFSDAKLDAMQAVQDAGAAVGPMLWPIIMHVVVMDAPARSFVQIAHGLDKRSAASAGVVLLKTALDALAVHYRMLDRKALEVK